MAKKATAAETRAARADQSKAAKKKTRMKVTPKIGPEPGAGPAAAMATIAEHLPASMSPVSQALFERSNAAVNAAFVVWRQAQEAHNVAISAALVNDGLPPLGQGPGELIDVGREGDQWVAPKPQARR